MRRLPPLLLTVLAVSPGLVGCGGTGGDAGADPAATMPAAASMYFEFVVRPEGEQKDQMAAFAGKVLRTDQPGRRIVELVESLDEDGGDGSYEEDVEPWLGRRAGAALLDFDGEEPSFVVAVATKDAGKAAELIEREARKSKEKRGSYKDHDVWVDSDGAATAVAGDYVLVGSTERLLRRAIDAQGGDSLAEADRYRKAIAELDDERAGAVYIDPRRFLDEIARGEEVGASEKQIFQQLFGGADVPPTAMAILVEDSLLALDARTSAKGSAGLARRLAALGYFGATDLVGEVPGDAWVSAGFPKLGETAKTIVNQFAGALGGAVLGGQLEQQLGIQLERDVYSWIGDVAVFVRGRSLPEIDGGLVIDVIDPAKARAALPRLVGALAQQGGPVARPVPVDGADLAFELAQPGMPQPVVVALGGDRATIAYGRAAAQEALEPQSKLADADLWDRATGTLDGLEPSFVLDAPSLLALVSSAATGDPDFARARPYLETIGVLAAGTKKDGDEIRSRFSLGLK